MPGIKQECEFGKVSEKQLGALGEPVYPGCLELCIFPEQNAPLVTLPHESHAQEKLGTQEKSPLEIIE